jgi:heterodisulfide reductase subunit A-like polyferredoxin
MQAHHNGTPMLASSGYLSRVDEENCLGCGTCGEYCQFDAMTTVDNLITIDESKCMGCGVCVSHCVNEALRLELAPWKGEPMVLPVEMAII